MFTKNNNPTIVIIGRRTRRRRGTMAEILTNSLDKATIVSIITGMKYTKTYQDEALCKSNATRTQEYAPVNKKLCYFIRLVKSVFLSV